MFFKRNKRAWWCQKVYNIEIDKSYDIMGQVNKYMIQELINPMLSQDYPTISWDMMQKRLKKY